VERDGKPTIGIVSSTDEDENFSKEIADDLTQFPEKLIMEMPTMDGAEETEVIKAHAFSIALMTATM
jgi:hypothetical protein